jgi:hypothetical protein
MTGLASTAPVRPEDPIADGRLTGPRVGPAPGLNGSTLEVRKKRMTKRKEKAISIVNRDTLVAAGMALLLLCLAGGYMAAF